MNMMLKRMNPSAYLLTFICALLVACAQLGLPTPETWNEKLAAAQASVTQVRTSATDLLKAGKLSSADGESVLKSTDAAAEGIVVARTIAAQDQNAAQARLTATVTILTAVNAYLLTKKQ